MRPMNRSVCSSIDDAASAEAAQAARDAAALEKARADVAALARGFAQTQATRSVLPRRRGRHHLV